MSPKDPAQLNEKKMAKPSSLSSVLDRFQLEDKGGYITQEFQDYAYRLACDLDDVKRMSLYAKLSKTVNRGILEKARVFVLDTKNVRNKSRLFLWAVGKLKKGEPLIPKK